MEYIKIYFGIFGYLFIIAIVLFIELGKVKRKVPINKRYSVDKFIAIIPAHNEVNVIVNSIKSAQKARFDRVIVILDNCTDNTPVIAKGLGCETIFVNYRSKGMALSFAIPKIVEKYGENSFYMFFDADNVIEDGYISKIKPYVETYPVIQTNVYNLNFDGVLPRMYILMNAIYLRFQKALTLLKLSSLISGYGWGAYGWVFKKYKFDCHSVVEDLEYTLKLPLKVVFIDDATVFDEKPTEFVPSFKQRLRWYRGYFYNAFREKGIVKNVYTTPVVIFCMLGIAGFIMALPEPLSISVPFAFVFLHTLIFLLSLNEREIKDVKRYDIFILIFFNLTNLIAIIFAMFTNSKSEWESTPHTYRVNI
jgi:cellulose synthase/poly-beta-1,6-N-acetylglucosamine synthase-like glycosyltransferase